MDALATLKAVVERGLDVLHTSTDGRGLETHEYEHVRVLRTLQAVSLSNADGVARLAPDDGLLSAAWTCGRAASLAACRCLWLEEVDDLEREVRLVALIREAARGVERMADGAAGEAGIQIASEGAALRRVADQRAAMLGASLEIPGIPTDTDLTRAVSASAYALYIAGSQFAHGTLVAAALDPGVGGLSRLPTHASWAVLLRLSWEAARAASAVLLNAAGLAASAGLDAVDSEYEAASAAYLREAESAGLQDFGSVP